MRIEKKKSIGEWVKNQEEKRGRDTKWVHRREGRRKGNGREIISWRYKGNERRSMEESLTGTGKRGRGERGNSYSKTEGTEAAEKGRERMDGEMKND